MSLLLALTGSGGGNNQIIAFTLDDITVTINQSVATTTNNQVINFTLDDISVLINQENLAAQEETLFGGVAHFKRLHERSVRKQEEQLVIDTPNNKYYDDNIIATEVITPIQKINVIAPVVEDNIVIDAAELKSEIRDELIKQYLLKIQAQRAEDDQAVFMMMLALA